MEKAKTTLSNLVFLQNGNEKHKTWSMMPHLWYSCCVSVIQEKTLECYSDEY